MPITRNDLEELTEGDIIEIIYDPQKARDPLLLREFYFYGYPCDKHGDEIKFDNPNLSGIIVGPPVEESWRPRETRYVWHRSLDEIIRIRKYIPVEK